MEIKDILEPSEYESLNQFTPDDIEWINGRINTRRNGEPGIECVVRGKNNDGDYFKLTPEEIVRQYYAYKLITEYGYDKEQLSLEEPVLIAGKTIDTDKRIDIAVFDSEHKKIQMIIEVKRPRITNYHKNWEGEGSTPYQQMYSYCSQKKSQLGVLVNGVSTPEFYDFPYFENQLIIDRFPQNGEDIQEWKDKRRFTLKQLMQSDRLKTETLKDIILSVEQKFGANDSSEKAFEEIFKLIFSKLYDEKMSSRDADVIAIGQNEYNKTLNEIDDSKFRVLEFRVKEQDSLDDVYNKINELFQKAQKKWRGVFPDDSRIEMQKGALKSCVKELQNVKLFNSNLEVVDDAFEHLVNNNQKSDMGQYFTPRYVIDMCVKMLNPKENEKMIDTAAGSCGFPMHTIFHVWKQMNPDSANLFTTNERTAEEKEYVQENVFGIDFGENCVRVGRMLNIIAGDGHTNVLYLNSLDYKSWDSEFANNPLWAAKYGEGFHKLVDLSKNKRATEPKEKYQGFLFDVLMANPPFAGDLDNVEQIDPYDLGHKGGDPKEKLQNAVGRDILFIERNLNFLKPGGRMAIVLPQGRFNNTSDKYIREYILKQCRLLAVVGLHGNTFKNGKSGTGTKTSVLFVQKWTDEDCGYPNICPKPDADENGNIDYPIFFATMQEPSKDNSGDKIYVTETYVNWTSYKYTTVKLIIRKSDKSIISEEEYNQIANKENYDKVEKNILYIRKSNEELVTEEEYLANKKEYKKKTIYEYKRKSDSVIISEDEYKEITKKSNYSIKIETVTIPEEHKTEAGKTKFIKDLFIEKFGDLESHKKWILKNSIFVLRDNCDLENPKELSIVEWLSLAPDVRALYKEEEVLGDNNNDIISNEEYLNLSNEEQKFYLKEEDVVEYDERVKDTHDHIFVKHDLFNHDPKLKNVNPNNIYSQNGIAEAFIKFAYDNKLSFAPTEEELNQIMHPENEFPF